MPQEWASSVGLILYRQCAVATLGKALSLAKTLGVLTFTPLTMLQASAQTVDFKVCRHFGAGQVDCLDTTTWSIYDITDSRRHL